MRTRNVLISCIVIAALAALGWVLLKPAAPKSTGPAAVPVHVITVVTEDVPRTLTGIGSVLSLHSVTIRPQVDGILSRLAVSEGQWVRKGDLLATIDDRSIRATLDQARAQLGQSQAQLKAAQTDLQRYKLLSTDNGVSRQTLDQQQALADQLKAGVLGNQAAIAAGQVQLSYTSIRSPVSGRVGIRNVDEGNFLRVSDATGLFTVTQIDPIAVEFSLPQQNLATLQALLDNPSPAPVRAYVDGDALTGSLLGEGHLTLLDNQVSANTGTIRAKAEFKNTEHKLWPGQLVSIGIQVALERRALVVPLQVVQRGIDGHFVYRLNGDKVETVPVKVRYENSQLNIIDGVKAGDLLVSDGQSRLKPGARVEVLKGAADGRASVESSAVRQ